MSIFKWTSPIRQGGLSPIPNEVYMEIFKYLRRPDNNPWIDRVHRRDFSRVALVCRFFCSVMLPWIYESMEFVGKSPSDSIALSHAPFCRSIIRGCESARTMATYVKRCSFADWIQDENESAPSWSWCNTEFQILYSKALAFMPNIEELKLTKVFINKYLLKSMMGLKCLTSLSLDLCVIEQAKAKHICRKLSTLQLKYLRLFKNPISVGHDDDMSLISQSLSLDSLLTVHTNCWAFVARIAEQNCHLPLLELDVSFVISVWLLRKIFQKTPALEKLSIPFAARPMNDVQFDDVLPALDELSCPVFLVRSLVPGRPISSIKFSTTPMTKILVTDILSLKQSTRKIRSLCVPIFVYQTVPFWEHFPDLKLLRLEFVLSSQHTIPYPLTKQDLEKCVSIISNTWPHNPPIQELHIDMVIGMNPFFDLELQNKLISTVISPRFTQTRRISISDHVVWNKVQEFDEVWKPSLHLIPIPGVAKRLRSGEVNVVDYDGFFEGILSTAEEIW